MKPPHLPCKKDLWGGFVYWIFRRVESQAEATPSITHSTRPTTRRIIPSVFFSGLVRKYAPTSGRAKTTMSIKATKVMIPSSWLFRDWRLMLQIPFHISWAWFWMASSIRCGSMPMYRCVTAALLCCRSR